MFLLSSAWAIDVPADYPSLEEAVQAAAPQDVITVDPSYAPLGTVVTIDKELQIRGSSSVALIEPLEIKATVDLHDVRISEASSGHLVVSGDLSGSGIHFTPSETTKVVVDGSMDVTGLVIDGHSDSLNQSWMFNVSGDLALQDCTMRDNSGLGGLLLNSNATLEMESCTLDGNTFTYATVHASRADVVLRDTRVSNNASTLSDAGGAVTANLSTLEVYGSRFENNRAVESGGDIRAENSSVTVDFFESHKASAKNGASIYLAGGADLDLKNGRFTSARPDASAVIYNKNGGEVTLKRTWFCDTQIQNGDFFSSATEVYVTGSAHLTLENVVIAHAQGDARSSILNTSSGTLRFNHVTAEAGDISTLVVGQDPALEFFNTIADGYGTVVSVDAPTAFSGSHNLYNDQQTVMESASGDLLGADTNSFVSQDPGFDSWDPSDCWDLPTLASDSVALGSGAGTDWKGDPSDIGALSGPGAQDLFSWTFEDTEPVDTGPWDSDTAWDTDTAWWPETGDSSTPDSHNPDTGQPPGAWVSFGPASGGCASSGMALSVAGLALLALGAVRRRPEDPLSGRLDRDA